MNKPIKHQSEPYWDWDECCEYIREKYGRDVEDWAGRFTHYHKKDGLDDDSSLPYQNFWIDVCEYHGSVPGAPFYLWNEPNYDEDWKNEIHRIFSEEFGEGPYVAC